MYVPRTRWVSMPRQVIGASTSAAGGEDAQVVEQGHRLGPVHLWAGGVGHRHQRAHLDPHCGDPTGEGMQNVHRQAEHGGIHEEQPAGRGPVGVDLLTGEAHPRGGRTGTDPAVDAGTEVPHVWQAGGAAAADVGGNHLRQMGQVILSHDRVDARPGQRCPNAPAILGAVAPRPLRGVPVHDGYEQDDVRHGAEAGVSPRGEDRSLRDDRRNGTDNPPPAEPEGQQHGGGHHEYCGGQPENPRGSADRPRQLGHLGPSEALGGAEHVDRPA